MLDRVPDPHTGSGNFWRKGHSAVTCAKTAEPIVMPFRWWARTGPKNHELDRHPDL